MREKAVQLAGKVLEELRFRRENGKRIRDVFRGIVSRKKEIGALNVDIDRLEVAVGEELSEVPTEVVHDIIDLLPVQKSKKPRKQQEVLKKGTIFNGNINRRSVA